MASPFKATIGFPPAFAQPFTIKFDVELDVDEDSTTELLRVLRSYLLANTIKSKLAFQLERFEDDGVCSLDAMPHNFLGILRDEGQKCKTITVHVTELGDQGSDSSDYSDWIDSEWLVRYSFKVVAAMDPTYAPPDMLQFALDDFECITSKHSNGWMHASTPTGITRLIHRIFVHICALRPYGEVKFTINAPDFHFQQYQQHRSRQPIGGKPPFVMLASHCMGRFTRKQHQSPSTPL